MTNIVEQILRANIYIQPAHFLLTVVTNLLNICVLHSPALRSSACTQYFLAYSVFSIVYALFTCPIQFLRAFSLVWFRGQFGCRMYFYVAFLIPFQASAMLILASFDRYCSSSKSQRGYSNKPVRTARTAIAVSSILVAIYMLPMCTFDYQTATDDRCQPISNLFVKIYTLTQAFLYYLLAPILTFFFGFLTIANIRQQSARTRPFRRSIRTRRTEGQLARMLLLQVSIHLLLILPFGITYLINTLVPVTQTPTVLAVRFAFVIWQQCDYFLSFFLYVFSGSVYREQLLRIHRVTKTWRSTKDLTKERHLTIPIIDPHASCLSRIRINGASI